MDIISSPWNRYTPGAPTLPVAAPAHAEPETESVPRCSRSRRLGAFMFGLISLAGAAAPRAASAQEAPGRPTISKTLPAAEKSDAATPPQTDPTKPKSDTTVVTFAPADMRTQKADAFLADWLNGIFDGRMSVDARLTGALRQAPGGSAIFPFRTGNAANAPSLESIGPIRGFDELRTRVDSRFAPGTDPNVIALDMGQRFGSQNYNYGAGGTIVSDSNAFDLYNKGKGVCVEIHSAVAAYRRAHGQEAYVVSSSAVGNSHAFLVYKDGGKWYVQNYGRVVETDARTLRELFDRAMPEETRPTLFEPQADGTLRTVGRGFTTSIGLADRRFSDFSGTGDFDPFQHGGSGVTYRDGRFTLFNDGMHLSADPDRQEVSAGFGYRVEDRGDTQTVSGFSAKARFDDMDVRAKWERESRWESPDRFGRNHFAVIGGVQMKGPTAQYWSTRGQTSVGQLGFQAAQNDSFLHGSSALKLETGYDVDLRAMWTYGLDGQTRQALTASANGEGGTYWGDGPRMIGEARSRVGVNAGAHFQPGNNLRLRAGVRMGADLASWNSATFRTGLENAFEPSAYAEARYADRGVVAGALIDAPINEPGNYRLATALGYAPTERLVLGASYARESFLGESYDQLQLGAGWMLAPNVQLQGGAYVPNVGRDGLKQIGGQGGLRINF